MIKRREWMKAAGFATLSLGTVRSVKAQPVPKLLKIINGFPPGGVVDAVARRVAEGLAVTEPGVNVIVDNRVGAGGRIAVSAVKAAVDDGSTLLFTPDAVLSLYPFVYSKLDYDPFADLAPVATVATTTDALALGPLVPPSVRGLRDFLAWAKEHPEHASFGSPGTGTPLHLLGALVAKEAGVYLRHVAYRGAAPGVTDLIGGQIACMAAPTGTFLSFQKAGKLRIIATSGPHRTPFTPDTPTFAEQKFGADYPAGDQWLGFFAPSGVSPQTVSRLHQMVAEAVNRKAVAEALASLGLVAHSLTPQAMASSLRKQHEKWWEVVRRVGFTAES